MARTAEVKRDARIGEAEARRDAQIKEAIAEEERMAARSVKALPHVVTCVCVLDWNLTTIVDMVLRVMLCWELFLPVIY